MVEVVSGLLRFQGGCVLSEHVGDVGEDGLDLLLAEALEPGGDFLDGGAGGQVLEDDVQGQAGVFEDPCAVCAAGVALYSGAVFPAQGLFLLFSCVVIGVSPRRELCLPILPLSVHPARPPQEFGGNHLVAAVLGFLVGPGHEYPGHAGVLLLVHAAPSPAIRLASSMVVVAKRNPSSSGPSGSPA